MPADCFIGLGSNLGDAEANIIDALREMDMLPSIQVVHASPLFQTKPIGPQDQSDFLNAVAQISTLLEPTELLHQLKTIETNLGRTPGRHWGERIIDLDILNYGDTIITTPELTIPHAHLGSRAFVLVPWHAITASFILPDGQSLESLYRACDKSGVRYHSELEWRSN